MGSESIAQLAGQKYRDKTTLAGIKLEFNPFFATKKPVLTLLVCYNI